MRLIDVDGINDFYIDFSSYKECPDEDDVKAWLDKQPTIEAEPVRHGEWIEPDGEEGTLAGTCSVCRWECRLYEDDVVGMPYCPNCGAKMDGKEKKE